MNINKNIDKELIDKIISVAYGNANLKDKILIKKSASKDEEIKNLLNEFKSTANSFANSLKEFKNIKCPDYLIQNAQRKIKLEEENSKLSLNDIFNSLFANKAKIFLTAASVIAFLVFTILFNPENANKYSSSEIKKAEIEATKTLAFVGSILNNSNKKFVNEILPKKVSKPVNDGIKIVNNLFDGEKNEKIN